MSLKPRYCNGFKAKAYPVYLHGPFGSAPCSHGFSRSGRACEAGYRAFLTSGRSFLHVCVVGEGQRFWG